MSDSMIDAEQVAFYRENGYLVLHDFFDAGEIAAMRAACDEMMEKARHLTESDADYDLAPEHGPDDIRIRRLRRPIGSDSRFRDISRSEKLIDVLAELIGPEIRITHPNGKINTKQAGSGAPVEWHQDWAGYPHTNEDLLAIGIPLDDCSLDNGPLLMLPGSHKGEVYSHHTEDGYFVSGIDPVKSGIDFSKAVALTGKAGMVTIHHVRMVHGSAANESATPRRLFIVQYGAVDAWPLLGVSDFDAFNAAIVRGRPTLRPRMEHLPVVMPTRFSARGVLHQSQLRMENRYFSVPAKR